MTKYLIIEKTFQGYRITDSETDKSGYYIGYSLRDAIRQHRQQNNLKYLHFEKIYLGDTRCL